VGFLLNAGSLLALLYVIIDVMRKRTNKKDYERERILRDDLEERLRIIASNINRRSFCKYCVPCPICCSLVLCDCLEKRRTLLCDELERLG